MVVNRNYWIIEKSKDFKLIFFPTLYKIYKIKDEKELFKKLSELVEEDNKEEENFLKEISKNFCNERKTINRLVLGISNICNFNCIYCYAQGGSYGGFQGLMSVETAKFVINKLVNNFLIKNIQFFGGEPLLGYETMEFVCKYFEFLYSNRKINYMPNFAVVTNGSILSKKIIELFKKYKIYVTVSLDGPPEINRFLRKDRLERDKNALIIKNIKTLINEGIKVGIEATYTNFHIENRITVWDCLKYFYEEFGFTSCHIPPVNCGNNVNYSLAVFPTNTQTCISIYREAIKECINSWINGKEMLSFSFLDRYLESILKKLKSPLFCPAYNETLAIWWNGDIYPCFMFYGNEQFKICNIENFEIFETDILKYNLKYLTYLKKLDREKCNNCVIRWLCNICIGGVYNEKSKIEEIPEYYCSWQKGMIEEIIGYLCYIKGNKNLWDRLVKNIKEKHEKFKS